MRSLLERFPTCIQIKTLKSLYISYLPSRRSFRGPYLSMMMPSGRVMALRRKEPMVKARFSISSCSLQMGQPFICKNSSLLLAGLTVAPILSSDTFCIVLLPKEIQQSDQTKNPAKPDNYQIVLYLIIIVVCFYYNCN